MLEHRGDHTFEVVRSTHLRHDRGTTNTFEEGSNHGRLNTKRQHQARKFLTRATRSIEKRPNGGVEGALDVHKSEQARALAQIQQVNERLDSVRTEINPDAGLPPH